MEDGGQTWCITETLKKKKIYDSFLLFQDVPSNAWEPRQHPPPKEEGIKNRYKNVLPSKRKVFVMHWDFGPANICGYAVVF